MQNAYLPKSEASEKSTKIGEDLEGGSDSEGSEDGDEKAPPVEEVVKDNWGPLAMTEKVSVIGFEEVFVTKGHSYIVKTQFNNRYI